MNVTHYNQQIVFRSPDEDLLDDVLSILKVQSILLVCDKAFDLIGAKEPFDFSGISVCAFDDFSPNPQYVDILKGVKLFTENTCDCIVAIGGGSTIDVAKCIKLFSSLNKDEHFSSQKYRNCSTPLIAVPTTAGTGSESTHFAVVYRDGVKHSVGHESLLPDYAVIKSSLLSTLPAYQKKCTVLDALCQALESLWSVHSTEESRIYSRAAVDLIWKNIDRYIDEHSDAYEAIAMGSNCSGRAINLTFTTAPHAMSYILTSRYGVPHGHAVALCLPAVWRFMCRNIHLVCDKRGESFVGDVFSRIASALGARSPIEAANMLERCFHRMGITCPPPICNLSDEISLLSQSVNSQRLSNSPVRLDGTAVEKIYTEIMRGSSNYDE